MSDIQSAIEKARQIAARLSNQLPDGHSASKRAADSSSDESSSKKFASVNDAVGAQLAMFKAQHIPGHISEEYKCPDKLVGLVIGRGGEQLKILQSESQCKIAIAPDSHGLPDRILTLTGTKEGIERAKKSLDELTKKGDHGGSNGQYGRGECFELKIPGNKCGLIIGKGGETIKRLSEQYGVKLVVVQDTSEPTSNDKPLRITGDPDKVAKAKEAVLGLLNPTNAPGAPTSRYQTNDYGSRSGSQSGGNEAYIKVPGDKAGIVIGKGGESIKEINRRSGAHVEIDKNQRNTDGNDKMFVIRGTNEQIQFAQQLIYEKISGVPGSTPPSGFFGGKNDNMSPLQNPYGSGSQANQANAASAAAAYGQQWANPYQQQWPGADVKFGATSQTDPNMSAAWAAYYQQYYGQAGQPAATGVPATSATAAGASSATAAQPSINPQTGQPDYSQAWVEYYRSLGMHEQADAILRQTAQNQANGTGSSAVAGSSTSAAPTGQQSSSSSTNGTQQNGTGSSTPNQSHSSGYPGQGGSNAAWSGYSSYQNYGDYYKQTAGAGNSNSNGQ